jgi:DNA-directed RNA polymerase subunit H (RpoH/RPB5)
LVRKNPPRKETKRKGRSYIKEIMLRRVKRNQVVMIRDRGYLIPEEERFYLDPNYDPDQIGGTINRDDLTRIYAAENGRLIYVSYLSAPKSESIGIDPVRRLFESIDELGQPIHELVLITSQTMGAAAIDYLNGIQRSRDGGVTQVSLSIPPTEIQHFYDVDLAYNPIKHYLVPTHEPLSQVDQERFLSTNHISIKELPILVYSDIATMRRGRRKGDPIVSYYRFRPNQIIRIKRHNFLTETLTDEFVSYRRVWY